MRRFVSALILALFLMLGLLLTGSPVMAEPNAWNVRNTNDSGPGSLRQAIMDANASAAGGTIRFHISGAGVHTISPLTNYPFINKPVVIDGYTQPGASPNTLALGDNAVILIELDGSNISGTSAGLIVYGGSTIRGMAFGKFTEAIGLNQGSNVVEGNFIGTFANGTVSRPNGQGVFASSFTDGSRIGGSAPAARNIVSGNAGGSAVRIHGSNAHVINNYVGVDKTGEMALGNSIGVELGYGRNVMVSGNVIAGNTSDGVWMYGTARRDKFFDNKIGVNVNGSALGNGADGIYVERGAKKNRIGGTAAGQANVIANNAVRGVALAPTGGNGNLISGNSIYSNGALGIDFNMDGVTANDVNDADTGPNTLQNFPIITIANSATQHIRGKIKTTPNTAVRIELFANGGGECDGSGNGEGTSLLGTVSVTTNGAGSARFNVAVTTAFGAGKLITATATAKKSTSEFSACFTAS